MAGPEILYTLAEISVAIADFSVIVVLFKRGDSVGWRTEDADRFHGMILHAMSAASFCFVPSAVAIFSSSPSVVWALSSGALGVQILLHGLVIVRIPTIKKSEVLPQMVLGLGIVVMLFMNVLGVGFDREFGPFLGGIFWHLLSAGTLFVQLIWISPENIQRD